MPSLHDAGLRRTILLGSTLAIVLVGIADVATGWDLSFSLFYFLGVAPAAWFVGRRAGIALAVLSGVALLTADLLTLPTNAAEWIPYWNGFIRLAILLVFAIALSSWRAALEREQALARIDSTTGAWNIRAFLEFLQKELERSRRNEQPFALVYLDLDNFKIVNDTHGHHEGNRLLATLVTTLGEALRAQDTIARLGGDEFAVLLPETDLAGTESAVDRALRAVRATMARNGWPVSASIGAAVFLTPPGSADDALRLADGLMYEAKRAGKDRFVVRTV